MTESFTIQLQRHLAANGFMPVGPSYDPYILYHKPNYRSCDITFKFLGGGWVEKYVREYPAKEGWYKEKHRCSEYLNLKGKEKRGIF